MEDKKRICLLKLNEAFAPIGASKLRLFSKMRLSLVDLFEKNFSLRLLEKGVQEKIEIARSLDTDTILDRLDKHHLRYLTIFDKDYPSSLKEIASPPPVLYYKGNIDILKNKMIAIVGCRKITDYGKTITEKISSELSRLGFVIVSGLALGVDTVAHQASLDVHGQTVAVLANGLDQIYPWSNARLGEKIVQNGGLILSEYPIGMRPLKQNFPARNRIISGISLGVLVTEASLKSGALITARDGLDQNKDIFAVPGSVFAGSSEGTNQLIKMGANVVTKASDVLEFYGLEKVEKKSEEIKPENKLEEKIFNILARSPKHIDEIIKESKEETQAIISTLTLMEIKGKVKNLGASNYLLNN